MKSKILFTFISILFLSLGVQAQTTTFTYQGELNDGAATANGTYDFQFTLYNQSGSPIGTVQTINNVTVADGIFTVDLNYGSALFDGSRRFLQIAVKKPADATYTTLTPLQEIKSSPYAIQAKNADTLDGLDSSNFINSSGGTVTGSITISGTSSAGIVNASTQFNLGGNRFISQFNNSVAVGSNTGSTDGENSFFGTSSGGSNTTGGFNAFYGSTAGFNNLNGSFNSFFGTGAGDNNISGNNNSFFGFQTGTSNTTGGNNTLLGFGANVGAGNLNFATAIGAGAVVSNSDSVVIGRIIDVVRIPGSLIANLPAGDGDYIQNRTTQQTSTNFNISGTGTVGGTLTAGNFNTSATYRINEITVLAAGGTDNLFVGKTAGSLNTAGQRNTFVGSEAGRNNEFGDDNTFVGFNTDVGNVTGQSGNNNTLLGSNASVGFSGIVYGTAIGSDSIVTTSNTIELGRRNGLDKVVVRGLGSGGSTTLCRNASNQISTCSSSLRYKSNIQFFNSGLNLVKKLTPITFDWKTGGRTDLGLGAEEVEKIEPLLVTYNEKGEVEGVKYDRIGVVLLNAVKEQQTQIEDQKKENERLKAKLEEQTTLVEGLRALVCADKPEAAVCKTQEKKDDEK